MNNLNDLVPFTPEWEFHRKQLEVLPSVGKNPDLSSVDCSSLPSDLVDTLSPLVKAASLTSLAQYNPYYSTYRQIQSRLEYLIKVKEYLTKESEDYLRNSPCKTDLSYIKANDYRRWQSIVLKMLNDDGSYIYESWQLWQEQYNFVKTVSEYLVTTNNIDISFHDDVGTSSEVVKEWRAYMGSFPKKHLDVLFNMPLKEKRPIDKVTQMVLTAQQQSRRALHIQKLKNQTMQCVNDGWFMIFDTLTISNERMQAFFECPTAIRDYCRAVGRGVNIALKRDTRTPTDDVYRYFGVAEYGTKNGRLHFHIVHYVKALPFGARDPLYGHPAPQLDDESSHIKEFKAKWEYGRSAAIATRYAGDPFTRAGWLAPRDENGQVRESRPVEAVINYVAKYVSKDADFKTAFKLRRNKDKWKRSMQAIIPEKYFNQVFRVRMSRKFGMKLPSMAKLTNDSLVQMTQLHWSVTPLNRLLKEKAKKELSKRLGILTIDDSLAVMPETVNLLKSLRRSIQLTPTSKSASSGSLLTPKLTLPDISKEVIDYVGTLAVQHSQGRVQVAFRGK